MPMQIPSGKKMNIKCSVQVPENLLTVTLQALHSFLCNHDIEQLKQIHDCISLCFLSIKNSNARVLSRNVTFIQI